MSSGCTSLFDTRACYNIKHKPHNRLENTHTLINTRYNNMRITMVIYFASDVIDRKICDIYCIYVIM